ncbi:hypothetical protein NECAME_14819 [Necator americanus]|uniref:Thrombospondin type 1 domain protein n=1 Tax=Necator americanus TaxID=51031 RepID=W2SNT8_NECAM|nr:hypothetical protein NECAME_14819 [Necator americanus]ETN70362.1 hypothetical protein NECAME_14819 [Necator americanus]
MFGRKTKLTKQPKMIGGGLIVVWDTMDLWSFASALGWAGWSPWTQCSRTECDTLHRTSRETVCGGEEILSKQQCEVVCKSRSSGSHFLWRMADGVPCQADSNRAVCSHGTCQIMERGPGRNEGGKYTWRC